MLVRNYNVILQKKIDDLNQTRKHDIGEIDVLRSY